METALDTIAKTLPDGAPEWIQLVPAGAFTGADGRGPFVLEDAEAVIAASMPGGRKLPIDENHAIDLLQANGSATPARGWIVGMEARADGIWGKVEWTNAGKQLVEDRSYGFISPVFTTPAAPPHAVRQILRASLVNDPNLNLKSLHSRQKGAGVLEELRKELGLSETATEAEVLAAVKTAHAAQTSLSAIAVAAGAAKDAKADDVVKAINAKAGVAEVLAPIAEAAGVAKDAKPDDIVKAINARGAGAGGESAELEAVKKENKSLHTRLTQVETSAAKERAVTAIDAAIKDGKIIPAMRDRMITRHMREPQDVEEEIKLLPSIHAGGLKNYRPTPTGDGQLDAEELRVCEMMGVDPKAFAETKKLERGA